MLISIIMCKTSKISKLLIHSCG